MNTYIPIFIHTHTYNTHISYIPIHAHTYMRVLITLYYHSPKIWFFVLIQQHQQLVEASTWLEMAIMHFVVTLKYKLMGRRPTPVQIPSVTADIKLEMGQQAVLSYSAQIDSYDCIQYLWQLPSCEYDVLPGKELAYVSIARYHNGNHLL